MAVWQFTLALVPQSWFDAVEGIDAVFDEEGYDLPSAWARSRPDQLRERLDNLLPTGESWSASLTIWGSEEHDNIQLWETDGSIEELSVRFDLRRLNYDLIDSVAILTQDLNLAILDMEHRRVLERTATSLSEAAAKSDAARFVADPHAFLSQVGEDDGTAT